MARFGATLFGAAALVTAVLLALTPHVPSPDDPATVPVAAAR